MTRAGEKQGLLVTLIMVVVILLLTALLEQRGR
jgi:hypothetical protein